MAVFYFLASAYGAGSYNSDNFNSANTTTNGNGSTTTNGNTNPTGTTSTGITTPAGDTSTTGASLTNTGFDIALIVGLAAAILLAAMVVRIWKRPVKTT